MKHFFISIILILYFQILGKTQVFHTSVFPNLTKDALLTALVDEFKTSTVLDYTKARDTLFSKIDAVQDSLECIYTGMRLYLTPGTDPTEAVYLGGVVNGINTEHSWPQSKGAYGLALSDMHHLYPSRIKTNSDRGDHPLGEIPDNETKTWYYKNTERSTPPPSGRDLYAEGRVGKFEPRESVKGNMARSLFYFYTMYKDQAETSDPDYFGIMKEDLCTWHYLDPVDKAEWERNQKIAFYQGGKLNPFILDCSLVSRAFCNNIDQVCENIILSSTNKFSYHELDFPVMYPNPGDGNIKIQMSSPLPSAYDIIIFNNAGRAIMLTKMVLDDVQTQLGLNISKLNDGMYFIQFTELNSGRVFRMRYALVR